MSDRNYNTRGNDLLGFESEKEYNEFCKYLIELYEENEQMTMRRLCTYVENEYGITLYHAKLKRIFDKFGVKVRDRNRKKKRTKSLRFTVDLDDYEYVDEVGNRFEGYYMKREFSKFCLHVIRGKPTPHLILWLSEFKTVIFLWDPKMLKYHLIGEDLSKMELNVLEELLANIEEVGNLSPVKSYARQKNMNFYGGNSE